MVKQLKLPLSSRDKIHNLNTKDRGRLISYLYHNFSEVNHERSLNGEKWKHNKLWVSYGRALALWVRYGWPG